MFTFLNGVRGERSVHLVGPDALLSDSDGNRTDEGLVIVLFLLNTDALDAPSVMSLLPACI